MAAPLRVALPPSRGVGAILGAVALIVAITGCAPTGPTSAPLTSAAGALGGIPDWR